MSLQKKSERMRKIMSASDYHRLRISMQSTISGGQAHSNGWTIRNGSVYDLQLDGMPTTYGSRSAAVPYYAGLIRPWEFYRGISTPLLPSTIPNPPKATMFPASRTDGNSSLLYAIPDGAQLQHDVQIVIS
jgi:hypothetical protein